MNCEAFNDVVPRFHDRMQAGRRLAAALSRYRRMAEAIVVGIPRGGVITAAAVAEHLDLPFGVLPVGKVSVPEHAELIAEAVGAGGVRVINRDVINAFRLMPGQIEEEIYRRLLEMDARQQFLAGRPSLRGSTVIVVDDGIATGATMEAATRVVRRAGAKEIVVAVPVGALAGCERLRREVDHFVCLETPQPFFGIAYWYAHFPAVEEHDVTRALAERQWSPLALA